ncbi:hypothetical protein M0R04_11020 [Candidatus Dojkabacteria bacterium]|nr:hypothetical protein [Candidatus Dojkabacteria bacterium]
MLSCSEFAEQVLGLKLYPFQKEALDNPKKLVINDRRQHFTKVQGYAMILAFYEEFYKNKNVEENNGK